MSTSGRASCLIGGLLAIWSGTAATRYYRHNTEPSRGPSAALPAASGLVPAVGVVSPAMAAYDLATK